MANCINFVETFCVGNEHAACNASLLSSMVQNNQAITIYFYADETHISAVRRILPDYYNGEIIFENLDIKKVRNSNVIFGALEQVKIIRSILRRNTAEKHVFCSIVDSSQIALKLIAKFSKSKYYVIPHAALCDLDKVYKLSSFKGLIKYLVSFQLWFRIFKLDNIKYIFLGKHINDHLQQRNLLSNIQHSFMEIPYIYTQQVENFKKLSNPITIGFLGIGSSEKGIEEFVDFYETCDESDLLFYHVGTLDRFHQNNDYKFKSLGSSGSLISFELFTKEAKKVDFFVLFLKEDEYKLRASGTFFDIIDFNVPIISLEEHFDYFASFGEDRNNYGIVAKNYEDLKYKILHLDQNRYKELKENLMEFKERISKQNPTKFLEL
ncbi:hypothetical protein VCR3J2_40123 [Vibrio coralliirubri]|uniref:hypothetical protein n=1 Tax=Vibrio coralliirubri TaxID=1516159 RepID=UPI00062F7C74|nr:hypothetical protein [Vibrio coralliirubri]CDT93226.1 hypothetical protein VCR3J2_40123 [Vibrio coralliirubri]